ncbi:protein FAM98B isoform X2 [Anoplophora glabripennis]|uniref:protein FAM98B isoform X2 n=1 Tax=Anoplophora glabripennis TaxID=217634 RepID=UPI0008759EAC|nr:protein FAM98B isoform X2 [Anoplophora glabripennis]
MSKLEEKILNGLNIIGYKGPLLQKPQFPIAVEGGPKNVEYTKLVNFLTNEIRTLLGIDEEVNEISFPEDSVAFVMEITSFLKELNCPYTSLTHGIVSERLQNVSDRLLLLDYLITELMGARILQDKKPDKKIELKLHETPEGADMRQILQTLRFPKPPANISITTLFQKLCPTIPIVLKKAGTDIIGNGIFNGFLSDKQWQILNDVQKDMNNEYKIRREMLLTRLDVTIQSFQWSNRTKGKEDMFENIYHIKRVLLKVDPDVDLSDLLAARVDLAIIEKTSNANVRKNTRSELNNVIIGQVPDRGGRTSEIAPPPPEMPSWQQRSAGGGGGRGGGNFSRDGGSNFSRGGGSNSSYSRGGGGGGGAGGRGTGYQSRGGYDNSANYGSNKSFDSAGTYNIDNRYGSNNRDSRDYSSGFQGNSARGYDNSSSGGYGGGGNYNRRDYDSGSYGANTGYDNGRDNRRGSGANKSTYADQYVQENQHNQQYQSRDNRGGRGGGRGRSNYHRGGGHSYR